MKIATTLYVIVMTGLLIALALFGIFSFQREARQFEGDMRRDTHVLGSALASAAMNVWNASSEADARELVSQASGESVVIVRWVSLDAAADDSERPYMPPEDLAPLRSGGMLSLRSTASSSASGIYTYVPIYGPSGRFAALELFESFEQRRAYTRESARNLLFAIFTLVLLSAATVAIVGYRLVGKRMLALMKHARRIGEGNLKSHVELRGNDEITELGRTMNQMATRLAESHEALMGETQSRLRALGQLRHTERVATLGQLSTGMAHELGTPLNVISGRAKLITTDPSSSEQTVDSSRIIIEQADRMTSIVRQFLEFGRRSKKQRTPEDLQQLLSHILELLSPMAEEQGVSLQLSVEENMPQVSVDRSQIQQVCMNLIRNGVQAMRNGGRLEVIIRKEQVCAPSGTTAQECAVIEVRDEGIGIPESELQRIFEPFFSTKSAGEGTGLGLAIVVDIIEDRGGWLTVESKQGEGSCFRAYLPLEEPG